MTTANDQLPVDNLLTRAKIGLFVVGSLLLLPVLIPYVLVTESWNERRLRAALRRTACITCGNLLTEKALERVQNEAEESRQAMDRGNTAVRYRMMPRPYIAMCTVCGQAYKWVRERNLLEPVPAEVVAEYTQRQQARAAQATQGEALYPA